MIDEAAAAAATTTTTTSEESTTKEWITLKSKDGIDFRLSLKAAKLSDLVRDSTMEDEYEDDDDENEGGLVVHVLRVHSDTLARVVDFMVHYEEHEAMKEIPTPLSGTTFDEIVTQEWYRGFLQSEQLQREQVFDLLTAANYMGIKPLLDLTCLKVTFELTGKTAEEIRTILNLPEMTPEEEAAARQEHRWIFEDN